MRRLLAWIPAIAWGAVIWNLSARPRLPGPEVPGIDKAAHVAAYALLAWLLVWAADRSALPLAVGAVLGLLYGATDEVHQMFVPGRSPDVLDWFADAVGVAAATYAYTRLRARRAARSGAVRGEAPSLSA